MAQFWFQSKKKDQNELSSVTNQNQSRIRDSIHPFAIINCSQLITTDQSQGEHLRSVNHSHACPAGSPPPPHRCSACSYLVWYVQAQTLNNGREQIKTTEPKNSPPLPMSKRRNKKTDEEKQCKNKELDQAREKTRIHFGASFQRWREICKDSRVTQS